MKNIYNKIRISPFFIFIMFITLISGLFKDIITLFIIIIIHELGHALFSIMLNWKISKINITICGGYITYDDIIDKPFIEELIIALAGFMFQLIVFLVCYLLLRLNIIDNKLYFLINKYNLAIFIFNILPIYPLDGSKIILIILNIYLPYKTALKILNILSFLFILCIISVFYMLNIKIEYGYLIVISFIISKLIKHIKEVPYLFNKLLFERYMYPIKVKKYNYVNNDKISLFKRRKKNYFKINNHYLPENVILSKKFD